MMVSEDQQKIAAAARKMYEDRLRETLEDSHMDEFVAIEPISGNYSMHVATNNEAQLAVGR